MDSIKKIFKLMEENHVTPIKLQKDLNLSSGLISHWKSNKQKPSTEVIVKIANYFNVSTDYLLGVSDDPSTNNSNPINHIELPNIYLRFARKAHDLKMSEKDMETLLDFFNRAKKHDKQD